MKSVSVIIPIYNKSQYISECLNSVLTQTLEDIEIICIDDGSTDDSVEIVEFFAESHDNIILIKKENEGVGKARNLGIETATKKYICFMDPDDYYPDDEILKTLYNLAEFNDVKICGGSFSSIKNGKLKTDYSYPNEGYRFSKEGIIEYSDYQFDYGFHRFIYRRDMILEKNIRFPNYIRFQDPPFFVSCMISAGSFYATPTETYRYREGYKKLEWNLSKKIDNLQGMLEILDMAHKNNLDMLKERMFFRMTSDYYRDIIIRNDSRYEFSVVSEILERINKYIDTESKYYIKFLKLFDEVNKNAKKKADVPPAISIVIPVYNVEKYIGECLDSVIHQDFKDIEMICVDDGTKDRSAEICETYAEKDSRITVVHRFNGGLSRARNTGADFADGVYLYFLDSDDMLNEGALSIMYREMSENSLDALFFDAKTIFELETPDKYETKFKNQYADRMDSTDVVDGKFLFRKMIDSGAYRSPVQLSAVSKNFYDSTGLRCFPDILHEDNLYTFEVLIYAKRAKYIAEKLYVRRIREDSIMTSEKSFKNFYGFLKVYTEMNRIIKDTKDPCILELATIMKERNKRSARVVFESLTYAERNLINNMNVQDRTVMMLDPPFEIDADKGNLNYGRMDIQNRSKYVVLVEKGFRSLKDEGLSETLRQIINMLKLHIRR